MNNNSQQNIIIYKTADGKASVALYAKDGNIWMNQNQLAELFATSKQNIGQHISNILNEGELEDSSVVKNYFTTANDGKQYNVTFYSLDMILAIGFQLKISPEFALWVLFLLHIVRCFLQESQGYPKTSFNTPIDFISPKLSKCNW